MRRNTSWTMLIVVGLLLTPMAAFAESKQDDEAAIRKLEDRFGKAFAAKDLDGIMAGYWSDSRLFVYDAIPPREYVGIEAYRDDFHEFLAMFDGPIKFEISNLAIDVEGDMAWSHSIQRTVGVASDHGPKWAPKGQPLDMTFRITDVYRKMKGKWLVVHEHVSWPVDGDTLKADIAAKP
jgi:ketosteroid isomerase-like protein